MMACRSRAVLLGSSTILMIRSVTSGSVAMSPIFASALATICCPSSVVGAFDILSRASRRLIATPGRTEQPLIPRDHTCVTPSGKQPDVSSTATGCIFRSNIRDYRHGLP